MSSECDTVLHVLKIARKRATAKIVELKDVIHEQSMTG